MKTKFICYSAPGRIALFGVHAALYGKPTLVCAINKRLSITFTPTKKTHYTDDVFPKLEQSVIHYLSQKKIEVKRKGFSYHIESTLPIKRGLGSSGALCACVAAGLLELFTGERWNKDEVNICAYQMEKHFHKYSSGVDTSTSIMGGFLYVRKEFEFLKTLSSLPIKVPQRFIESLILIDTGDPTEKADEIQHAIGSSFNARNTMTETLLNENEKITKRIVVSLMKEDIEFFKEIIQKNQTILKQLGVVSHKTILLLNLLKNNGVGTVIGWGGAKDASGYVLFFSQDINKCKAILDNTPFSYEDFVPDYRGLVKEQ